MCMAFFGLAYCVPFNNINNLSWHFHLHEKDKNTVLWHAQAYSFLQTLILICFLDNFKYVNLLNIFYMKNGEYCIELSRHKRETKYLYKRGSGVWSSPDAENILFYNKQNRWQNKKNNVRKHWRYCMCLFWVFKRDLSFKSVTLTP